MDIMFEKLSELVTFSIINDSIIYTTEHIDFMRLSEMKKLKALNHIKMWCYYQERRIATTDNVTNRHQIDE
jgi:hypothetical protein